MTARDVFMEAGRKMASRLPGIAEQAETPVNVQKVVQSLGSKVMAGGLPALAALLAFLGELPPYPRAGVVGVGILASAWIWNESKKRQTALQMELIKAGASQVSNNVKIEPAPAKAG